MTRWIMIAMTLVGLIIAFLASNPGLLGVGLVLVFVGLFGTVFSLASARISASARPDTTMLSPEVLRAIRDKANREGQAGAGNHGARAQPGNRPQPNQ